MTELMESVHRAEGPRADGDVSCARASRSLRRRSRKIGDRALYATDASNYRQIPYGVVLPKTAEDVVAAVRLCNAHDVPITPRGGGTSLAAQTCNISIIIDFSKYMHRILSIDPKRRTLAARIGNDLLRRPFGDGGAHRGQCARARYPHL